MGDAFRQDVLGGFVGIAVATGRRGMTFYLMMKEVAEYSILPISTIVSNCHCGLNGDESVEVRL